MATSQIASTVQRMSARSAGFVGLIEALATSIVVCAVVITFVLARGEIVALMFIVEYQWFGEGAICPLLHRIALWTLCGYMLGVTLAVVLRLRHRITVVAYWALMVSSAGVVGASFLLIIGAAGPIIDRLALPRLQITQPLGSTAQLEIAAALRDLPVRAVFSGYHEALEIKLAPSQPRASVDDAIRRLAQIGVEAKPEVP